MAGLHCYPFPQYVVYGVMKWRGVSWGISFLEGGGKYCKESVYRDSVDGCPWFFGFCCVSIQEEQVIFKPLIWDIQPWVLKYSKIILEGLSFSYVGQLDAVAFPSSKRHNLKLLVPLLIFEFEYPLDDRWLFVVQAVTQIPAVMIVTQLNLLLSHGVEFPSGYLSVDNSYFKNILFYCLEFRCFDLERLVAWRELRLLLLLSLLGGAGTLGFVLLLYVSETSRREQIYLLQHLVYVFGLRGLPWLLVLFACALGFYC